MPSPDPKWLAVAQAAIQIVQGEEMTKLNVALDDLLAFSTKNSLLYAVGERVGGKRPFPYPHEAQMQKVEERAVATGQMVSSLWPKFEEAKLPLLTMKTFLPFRYIDSNIDCLCVPPHPPNRYAALLHQAGFRWFKNLADVREPLKRSYLHRTNDRWPAFHLHTAVSWNGIRYLDLEQLWQRRTTVTVDGIELFTPDATDELIILLAHALFENKYVTLHELIYLHNLCQQGVDWERVWQTAVRFHWQEGMSWMLALCQKLAAGVGIELDLPVKTAVSLPKNWHLPYLIPPKQTFPLTFSTLKRSLSAGQWGQLPRRLFSYTLVDGLWMMRKARKKCRLEVV